MNHYFGTARCNISALLGSDMLLRVDNGCLKCVRDEPIYDIEPMSVYCEISRMPYNPTLVGHRLTLEIITGLESYNIEKLKWDCDVLPISDKRVDDCTVNELLFSIQKKMGLIPDLK